MRAAPLTGLLGVACTIAAFAVGGDTPDVGARADSVANFYDTHETRQLWAVWLLVVAGALLVFFAGQLAHRLRRDAATPGWLPPVVVAGGALTAAGFWVAGGTSLALVDAADEKNVRPEALQALNVLSNDNWVLPVAGLGILALAAGLGLVRGGGAAGLPRWMGWVALVVGLAMFVPFASWVALWLVGLWIIAASLILVLRHDTGAPPTSAQAHRPPGD